MCKNTKVFVGGRKNKTRVLLKIRGNLTVKQVDGFTYLGKSNSNDERNKSETMKRICQAKIAFNHKTILFAKRKNFNLKTRKNLIKPFVWNITFMDAKPGQC